MVPCDSAPRMVAVPAPVRIKAEDRHFWKKVESTEGPVECTFMDFHVCVLKTASMNYKKTACNCNCKKEETLRKLSCKNTAAFASATAPSQTLLPVSACSWLSIGRRSGSSPSKMATSPILSVSEVAKNDLPLGEFHRCC